ncbi:MAG: hypothetical protein Tsb005_20830 [Gammaproteobacteria bacterium]
MVFNVFSIIAGKNNYQICIKLAIIIASYAQASTKEANNLVGRNSDAQSCTVIDYYASIVSVGAKKLFKIKGITCG